MTQRLEYVVSIMSRDRVGIVAGVSAAIRDLGGNIDAMSQTVMRGYFTIIITASFPEGTDMEKARARIEASGDPGELSVSIKPWESSAAEPYCEVCDQFVLSIMGEDSPGIIAKICGFLASRNINIEDLYAYVDDGKFIFISQLRVPRAKDVRQLQIDIEGLYKGKGMVVHLQHENIFLATQKVDFRGGEN